MCKGKFGRQGRAAVSPLLSVKVMDGSLILVQIRATRWNADKVGRSLAMTEALCFDPVFACCDCKASVHERPCAGCVFFFYFGVRAW